MQIKANARTYMTFSLRIDEQRRTFISIHGTVQNTVKINKKKCIKVLRIYIRIK